MIYFMIYDLRDYPYLSTLRERLSFTVLQDNARKAQPCVTAGCI